MLYYVEFTTSNKGTFAATFVEVKVALTSLNLPLWIRSKAMQNISPDTTDLTVHIYEIYPDSGKIMRSWMVWWQGSWGFGPGKWVSLELDKEEWEIYLAH